MQLLSRWGVSEAASEACRRRLQTSCTLLYSCSSIWSHTAAQGKDKPPSRQKREHECMQCMGMQFECLPVLSHVPLHRGPREVEPLPCMGSLLTMHAWALGPQGSHAMASACSHLSLQLCSGESLLLGSQCLLCGVRWAATDMRGYAVPCFNKLAWSLPPLLPVLS